jgi:type IV secretory pathway TraG/TraD family ATPase VirD4
MSRSIRLIEGATVTTSAIPDILGSAKVILPGTHKNKPAQVKINEDILSRHTLLIGGTGCGKTTLFYHFVKQLREKMSKDDVMIVFDSKGDFYSKFSTASDFVLGNSQQYTSETVHWNIFKEILADGKNDVTFSMNSQEICRSFFAERLRNNSQPFFPNAARDILASILIAFVRYAKADKDFAQQCLYNDELVTFIQQNNAGTIIDFIAEYDDLYSITSYISGGSDQSQGVLSELYSVFREIFVGAFAANGMFSMREFVRNKGGKVLFIEYDLSIGQSLTPIYRLLIDLALKEALGRNKASGNVYIICDEFKLLPHLQHIDDGVNFGRSLGVKVFAGLQSIEQLYEIYGPSRGRNIAAGFSSVYAFHANDEVTRKFISGLFGKNIILEQYSSADNRLIESKREGYTVEDWDITSLGVGEAIVGLPFKVPFRIQFENYTG